MNEFVYGVIKLCDIFDFIEGKKNYMISLLFVDGVCKF